MTQRVGKVQINHDSYFFTFLSILSISYRSNTEKKIASVIVVDFFVANYSTTHN